MKKILGFLIIIAVLGGGAIAKAQKAKTVPRVGYVGAGSPATAGHHVAAFLQGLRARGHMEGQSIAIEYRWAEGKLERLPALVADVVRLKVDVIVSSATAAIRAAKEQTSSIPIVMAGVTDPVGLGLVASLARPGGNITGLTHLGPDLSGKRLELLKEAVPRVVRVAVLWDPKHPGAPLAFKETQVAAKGLRMRLISLEARNREELERALLAIGKERPQGLFVLVDTLTFVHRELITEVAAKHRLPSMYGFREFVDIGGLMSYGTNFADLFRRAATFVDKILKGTMPADLPVEQPMKFEFIVNLRTAKQIGVTIEPNVLVRANEVIR